MWNHPAGDCWWIGRDIIQIHTNSIWDVELGFKSFQTKQTFPHVSSMSNCEHPGPVWGLSINVCCLLLFQTVDWNCEIQHIFCFFQSRHLRCLYTYNTCIHNTILWHHKSVPKANVQKFRTWIPFDQIFSDYVTMLDENYQLVSTYFFWLKLE